MFKFKVVHLQENLRKKSQERTKYKKKKGTEMLHTNLFLELENILQFMLICLQTFL